MKTEFTPREREKLAHRYRHWHSQARLLGIDVYRGDVGLYDLVECGLGVARVRARSKLGALDTFGEKTQFRLRTHVPAAIALVALRLLLAGGQ